MFIYVTGTWMTGRQAGRHLVGWFTSMTSLLSYAQVLVTALFLLVLFFL